MNRGKGRANKGGEIKWSIERLKPEHEVTITKKDAMEIRDGNFKRAAGILQGKLKWKNLQFLKYPEALAVLEVPEDEASNILHKYNVAFKKEPWDGFYTTNMEMNAYREMKKRLGFEGGD